jgi:alcohol dehydrogenase
MGSMAAPLPLTYGEVMRNNLEIIGHFMYPANIFLKLLALIRSGLLDLSAFQVQSFPLSNLPAAMEAAAISSGLGCVLVKPDPLIDPKKRDPDSTPK